MQALLLSTGVVALAEMGDKTQLLALILAVRYRRIWPLAIGILVATLANHAAAAWLGQYVADAVPTSVLHWALVASLLGMAVWVLVPDRMEEGDQHGHHSTATAWRAFAATTVAFFVAEIGDKTQIATVLLAARFEDLVAVVAGTTLGMLMANLPVLWLGDRFAGRLPLRATRLGAAAVFAALAIYSIWRPVV